MRKEIALKGRPNLPRAEAQFVFSAISSTSNRPVLYGQASLKNPAHLFNFLT
jgi:hypothetical protein